MREIDEILGELRRELSTIAKYEDVRIENDAFNLAFARIFATDIPDHDLGEGVFGASRSNWTYHTASAMGQTAKVFGLTCRFETAGKRDAVFESRDDPPEKIIVAEWEWDYKDIFGNGKELEKLRNSCRQVNGPDALLLVYCPVIEVSDFLCRISKYWQKSFSRGEGPVLYIHVVVFELKGNMRELLGLVTIAVFGKRIWLMSALDL